MAEEEIIILEAGAEEEGLSLIEDEILLEDEAAQKEEEKNQEISKVKSKKRMILLSLLGIVILLGIIVAIVIKSLTKEPAPIALEPEVVAPKELPKPQFSPSKLETMIKKANLLYEQGNKDDALKIYERIATFNEAISFYNIGVAKMKEQNFTEALESFKKAIQNKEHRCISAINAAVCSLELKDEKLFNYYIDLAFAYLPEESNAPLYSYYVGLVHYYKNFYYEALSAISHPVSAFYEEDQDYISSKILASLSYTKPARDRLLKIEQDNDNFTQGLLHAKLGEFDKAQAYLNRALKLQRENIQIKMALSLVENKLGNLASSASLLSEISKVMNEDTSAPYPIRSMLKPSLFNVQQAQSEFEKELFFNNENIYNTLFYYAPYKVFDAKQTIDYIRKGSMNIFIDEIGPALSYLKASSTISKVNISISKGIKKALDFHVYEANKIFEAMVEEYKNHSILHYNLALTYAQMGDYGKAYKNFSKSYHLDNNNYLAGIFALMCGDLMGKDILKLTEDIKESLSKNHTLKDDNLYAALIQLISKNTASLARWLEKEKEETPLSLVLDTIAARKLGNDNLFRLSSQKLQALLPHDILANIIAFNVKHYNEDIKQYAKSIQIEFNNLSLDYDAFYYGPKIVKEHYVKLLQIGGLIHQKRDKLRQKMEEERVDISSIMQTLAYLEIYANQFEEAFVLYNKLIDDFNQKDTHTIFLASVAAIGAGHPENAIALLELSKLIDPTNLESRYALGLLYHEVGNFKAATTQYQNIGNIGFVSKYFAFDILK